LLTERGVEVDHVTIYRWVQRFTPLLATPPGHAATASEIAGRWTRPM
jgi:transposase-like protein